MTDTARLRTRLRLTIFAAALLVLVQAAIGMVVNLEVKVPRSHPGAHPSNYLSGSFDSVVWAIGHGALALAIHAALGLALVVVAVTAAARALRLGSRVLSVCSLLGAGLLIGAGFNGASFLDFNHDTNSLIMALLALAAAGCYTIALYLLAEGR